MAKMALILLVLNFTAAVLGTSLGNELTYSRTPVPGQPFTITWNPANYAVIDLLLWSLSGYPEYVPTTSDTIASKSHFASCLLSVGGIVCFALSNTFSPTTNVSNGTRQ